LHFSPTSSTYSTNRNFTVNVLVDSTDQAMNAAEGVINFPTDKLRVIGISKSGSIFSLFVQEPSFSNSGTTGNVRFEGVVLNPGFIGRSGKIISITFQAVREGVAAVSFASGSVLANDGQGTNILTPPLGTAAFSLQESATPPTLGEPTALPPRPVIKHLIKNLQGEIVLSQTSEEEAGWISSQFSRFTWLVPGGVIGVTSLVDSSSVSDPGKKSEGLFDNKSVDGLSEGSHYFHIRFINNVGAGPILHYRFMVDLTPPRPFNINFVDGDTSPNPRPRLLFSTIDDLSGLDHYEMKIGDGDWFDPKDIFEGAYVLPKQAPGARQILVRAFDKGGNFAEARNRLNVVPIASPTITRYPKNITSPGEQLIIGGTSLPNATIEINMTKRSKTIILFDTKADAAGNWEGVYKNIIPSGRYDVWAKQILDTGAESLASRSVYIRVNSIFFVVFEWLKNIGGVIILILIFGAGLAVVGYYFWYKLKLFHKKLKKETREAREALERGIKHVRKEVKRERPAGKISKELEAVEEVVKKELKDIEKL